MSTIYANGGAYEIYNYFLRLESNTYISNYASAGKGIISISGMNLPIIKSEYLY
jgi:hypothetical protein